MCSKKTCIKCLVKVWWLFKMFFTWKCIKVIFFLFLKKYFFIVVHQNNLKTQKKYQFEAKNKIKNFQIFSKALLKRKNKQDFTKLNYDNINIIKKNMYKMFGENVVAFKNVFYLEMHQSNIFLFFLKLFFIVVHQNNLKTQKKYQFEAKNKIKNFQIFSKALLKRKNKQDFTKLNYDNIIII